MRKLLLKLHRRLSWPKQVEEGGAKAAQVPHEARKAVTSQLRKEASFSFFPLLEGQGGGGGQPMAALPLFLGGERFSWEEWPFTWDISPCHSIADLV